jgi:hypothetical protein
MCKVPAFPLGGSHGLTTEPEWKGRQREGRGVEAVSRQCRRARRAAGQETNAKSPAPFNCDLLRTTCLEFLCTSVHLKLPHTKQFPRDTEVGQPAAREGSRAH